MAGNARGICVVGAGTMGGQIAYLAGLSGFDVALVSRSRDRLNAARAAAQAIFDKRVAKGSIKASDAAAALEAVRLTHDLGSGVARADVVIESVPEDRDIKAEVLERIAKAAPVDAIIGSNASTLGTSLFAGRVRHPERLLNLHFYNPPMVMPLVEVVRGPHTSDQAVSQASAFAAALGKTPVTVNKECFGFLANRMLFAAIAEAMRLVDDGVVAAGDCDVAVHNALGWPMGPFALSDLIGLDVVQAILDEGERQTGDASWRPPRGLKAKVVSGHLGRKTGQGFLTHAK